MNLNKENISRIRHLILFTIAMAVLAVNYQKVLVLLGDVVGLISPFILGAAIAFILNVPMRGIEKLIAPGKEKRWKRPVSLVLTIVAVISILLVVVFVVMPELVRTLMGLKESVPAFLENLGRQAEEFFVKYPDVVAMIQTVEFDWEKMVKDVMSFLSNGAGNMLTSTINAAASIVSGVMNFFIGFVFAVYILLQKETLSRQMKKLLKAYLPEKTYEKTLKVAVLAEKTFSNFLTGQCLEAVILGTMFFLVLTILRLPYALLIGVLIAFTALIPMFGAFIGCAVGAFLMLMVSPVQALIFVVVFLILQQVEGNLIYPHVVGGSVGLPSMWVLVAVTVGGNAMGVVGMLVFIPLCSVLYALVREAVNSRLDAGMIEADRPVDGETAAALETKPGVELVESSGKVGKNPTVKHIAHKKNGKHGKSK